MDARRRMSILLGGFAASQMLYVAARLKLADHLAAGPRPLHELAAETGAREVPLRRVIRALAAFGVFQLGADGCVANTPLSDCLRASAEDSLRDQTLLHGEESYHAMSELLQAVKAGGTAFEHAYRKPHFSYLAANPEAAEAFYATAGATSARAASALVKAYDFTGIGTVVEAGGGTGATLRAVLRANPQMKGVLVETAGLARKAQSRVAADGLAERCEVQAGDILESVPGGADAYVLSRVLHGLDDAHSVRVLRACARAMAQDSRLLIVELVMPDTDSPAGESQLVAISDVMALAVSGGRERTVAEIEALLAQSGLQLERVLALGSGDTALQASRSR